MLLWAIAPASDPATNRSRIPRVSWSVPIKRFICRWTRKMRPGRSMTCMLLKTMKRLRNCEWKLRTALKRQKQGRSSVLYLLVGHELDRRLRRNFHDVNAVPSPQRPDSSLVDHLCESTHYAHVAAPGTVHLKIIRNKMNTTIELQAQFHDSNIFIFWK